jgi:hypothetical protein
MGGHIPLTDFATEYNKMKRFVSLTLFIILFLALAWPQTAMAQGSDGDKFVLGGTYTLQSGETLDGNLFIFGGTATIEEGSQVTGDVLLAGGSLVVKGEIQGNIAATGGLIDLRDNAVVDGDVTAIAASLERDPSAVVKGKVNTNVTGPLQITTPGNIDIPNMRINTYPIWRVFWYFLRSFLWAALAVLVVLFLPHQVEQAAETAVSQPLITGGLGLLTTVVLPILLVVAAITIIGIPVSLLGALLLVITWSFGVIVIGTEVGKRLAQLFSQEWALALEAGVGTLLLTLVTNGLGLIPCVGWIPAALVGMVGLGAVLLTRFGTQPYPPASTLGVLPPTVPPAGAGPTPSEIPPAAAAPEGEPTAEAGQEPGSQDQPEA